jgi:O-Antigen ligase
MTNRATATKHPVSREVEEPGLPSPPPVTAKDRHSQFRCSIATWFDRAAFAVLCILALAAPHNVHMARAAFYIAFTLWVASLFASPRRLRSPALTLPTLAFLCLTALASSFSFAPLLSWTRMGWFTMAAIWVVVAHTVTSRTRSKVLIVLLLASTMVSVLRTGWQYFHGIGAELVTVAPETLLYRDGLRSGDVIQAINGRSSRTPSAFQKVWQETKKGEMIALRVARGAPTEYVHPVIARDDLYQWLTSPGNRVARGRPVRAQGHFYHYVPYAGMLTEIALLTFGLLLTIHGGARVARGVLWLMFAGMVAALLATVTRTYLAALLVGCIAEFLFARKKFRLATIGLLAVSLIGATFWIQKERGYGWVAPSDPGTDYRLLMWKTGGRLIPQHPWLGTGPDAVIAFGDLWKIEAYEKYPLRSHFHSTYIELAVDCGVTCLVTWLWLLIAYGRLLWRAWRRAEASDWFTRGTLLGIMGATVAFVAASLVHYNLGDGEVMMFIWFFMGIATALGEIADRRLLDMGEAGQQACRATSKGEVKPRIGIV